MTNILFIYIKYLLLTISFCSVYDIIVSKDDAICKLLQTPEGVDDVIIDEYKSVTGLFKDLAKEVKNRNDTVLQLAKEIYKRGEPRFLSLKFSLGKLKLHYNWGPRESNYFEFLTENAKYKWMDFEEEYKNYTRLTQGDV